MLFDHQRLHTFVTDWCGYAGCREEEAGLVADHLIEANLTGHDSHGIGMLPLYARSVVQGLVTVNGQLETETDFGAILALNGKRGFGQVMARQAIDKAAMRAKETGACILALRNCHHIGRIGHWAEQAASLGLVSIHFVNVIDHSPLVASFGGYEARLGTNPVCMAIPALDGKPAAMLDMATSQIALGKCRVAMNAGKSVQEGALVDPEGRPTNDPSVMFAEDPGDILSPDLGALLPFGAHKGSGLMIMAEILAGVVTGAKTMQPEHERHGGIINNMLSVLIDPKRLSAAETFHGEMDRLRAYLQSARHHGDEPPLLPGDPEKKTRALRRREGIPLDETTRKGLIDSAVLVGMPEARADAALQPKDASA